MKRKVAMEDSEEVGVQAVAWGSKDESRGASPGETKEVGPGAVRRQEAACRMWCQSLGLEVVPACEGDDILLQLLD